MPLSPFYLPFAPAHFRPSAERKRPASLPWLVTRPATFLRRARRRVDPPVAVTIIAFGTRSTVL